MKLKKLYEPKRGQMQVAGLMSGSGTNLRKIIEHEKDLEKILGSSSYHVAVIFSDNFESNAVKIGRDYDLPVITRDINSFYASRGKSRNDLGVRPEFDAEIVKVLAPYNATVAAYAGYMSIATEILIEAFLGVNVHPADLSIMQGKKRKYTGGHAVRDAILAGEKQIYSTTHLIEPEVDYGRILMISAPLPVKLPDDFDTTDSGLVKTIADAYQSALKEVGDWKIFPRTLQDLAEGKYAADETGLLYFEGNPIPFGIRCQ